jgi:hypothetical protein
MQARGRYYPKVPDSKSVTALREGMRVFDRSPWGWMKRGTVVGVEGRLRQIVITEWDDGGTSVCVASRTAESYGILCLPAPKGETPSHV